MKQHITLLSRKKTVLALALLAPLLILLIAGIAYDNTNVYTFRIGVVGVGTDNSLQLISAINSSNFTVFMEQNSTDCIKKVVASDYHACITFAEGFEYGVNGKNSITFHVDPSRTQLVNTIKEKFRGYISVQSQQQTLGKAATLLSTINDIKSEAESGFKSVDDSVTSNDNSISSVKNAQTALGNIDVSPVVPGAGMISTHKDSLDAQAKKTIGNTVTQLNSIQSTISVIIQLDNSQTNITSHSLKIQSAITNLTSQLSIDSNATNASLLKLNDTISSLSSELLKLSDTLKKSSDEKSKAGTALSTAIQNLDSGGQNLRAAKNSIKNIIDRADSLSITDASQIALPIITNTDEINVQSSKLPYTFPTLAILVLSLTALLITPAIVVYDKTSPAHIREQLSPQPSWKNVFSIYTAGLLITLLEALLIFALLYLFYSKAADNGPAILFALFISGVAFTALGLLTGVVSKSEEMALIIGILLITVMLILSDVILPLATVPQSVQDVASYNPLYQSTQFLRKATIHGQNFSELLQQSVPLLITAILFLAVSMLLSSKKVFFTPIKQAPLKKQ